MSRSVAVAGPGIADYQGADAAVRRRVMSRESLDLEALYRRYGDLVHGRCRALLRNDADAQEITQEIFLKVWRYREGFRGEASPSTYLFKVTTTTCLNLLRTRRRRPEDLLDEVPVGSTDTLLGAVETRQLLDLLLAEEDDGTVAAVVYHYVDGMTHDEAGELLGVTGGAVRKRIAQFRARVQGRLAWLEER